MNTAQTWAAALIVALLLGVSYKLDGPDDVQAAQDVADELLAAQSMEARHEPR